MENWSSPKCLVKLADFYADVQGTPESVSDADFMKRITETFWPTSCWCFVEEAFAIIAPGCAMRPHLTRALIVHPIEAMIAGGLEDENEVIGQGMACATKTNPYVEPTAEGKRWLCEQWPLLELLAIEVFRTKLGELTSR
ncbi:hypothetical protein [Massilia sp. TWP1-3-3]|uniref:hypothetical protein n=1 Tax=Massilia sp. TWP1-3-3 TaxID=2804573 RepID=UPI003CE79DC6